MSAYIVEDKTINRIVSWVDASLQKDHSYLCRRLLDAAEVNPVEKDWAARLGISMAILNDRAVNARYGEGTSSKDREGITYRFKWEPTISKIQVLKSLQCWTYQCAEGDIPETSELYKVAEEVVGYLAASIVSSLPEYDKAQWA
jgi:hypothetical protein